MHATSEKGVSTKYHRGPPNDDTVLINRVPKDIVASRHAVPSTSRRINVTICVRVYDRKV